MGTVIAINGKGGTGKTTVSSLIVDRLIARRSGSILAIDADPNSCFADSLGVREPQTIVGVCEDMSKRMDKIPAGMTKERFIEMRVQESLTEEDDFDMLVMGRPEGPGCYCYVNNLLRDLIGKMTKNYDYVVIDNAAGMEHISRRTMGTMNKLILVSDYSIPGVRSTRKIYDLARELKIKVGGAYMIVNRVAGPLSALQPEIDRTGLEVAGEIPYSEDLVAWSISGQPIFKFDGQAIKAKVETILKKVVG